MHGMIIYFDNTTTRYTYENITAGRAFSIVFFQALLKCIIAKTWDIYGRVGLKYLQNMAMSCAPIKKFFVIFLKFESTEN